jgi:hypothetical protein
MSSGSANSSWSCRVQSASSDPPTTRVLAATPWVVTERGTNGRALGEDGVSRETLYRCLRMAERCNPKRDWPQRVARAIALPS